MDNLNAFTVDVEDYFHVSAFERQVRRDEWDQYQCRIVGNTHRFCGCWDAIRSARRSSYWAGWPIGIPT